MKARARVQVLAGGVLGAVLIGTVALPSSATAEDEVDSSGVDVSVEIGEGAEPGVLALSVDSDSVQLLEDGTTPLVRQFTGTLPTVTVTDTRTAEEVPEGAFWSVLGTASDFTGDAGTISADHFGWTPQLVDGDETGLVEAGQEVVTVLDDETEPGNNVGLVDRELLVSTFDSGEVAGGTYKVDADLFLRTPADVAAGNYHSTITLSLFE